MSEQVVLKWAWRYHTLYVDRFDTLDAALRDADSASSEGSESLDHIEVWTENGQEVLSKEEVWGRLSPIQEREYAEWLAEVARVEVSTVGNKGPETATLAGYRSLDEAKADFDRLRQVLGDRVRLVVL